MHRVDIIARSVAPLVVLAAVAAYLFPPLFLVFEDSFLWFFAVSMFGLGLTLEPRELADTLARPLPLALGLLAQYMVMPVLGLVAAVLALMAGLAPGIALGFVILGAVPGSMASNVVVYLAGGAVAYSIALTVLATVVAPLLTPVLVQGLGATFVSVPAWPLAQTMLVTVIGPLVMGYAARGVLGARVVHARVPVAVLAVAALVVICGYATAANQDTLADVGWRVLALVALVNGLGYLAGWWLARAYRFSRGYRIALTIEVGMQNGGLGAALALAHFPPETALPGAVFAVWCTLTAAAAAAYFRRARRRTGGS